MRNTLVTAISFAMLAAALPGHAQTADDASAAGYASLNDDFGKLRDDFNAAKGSVRLLFVVDPICPGCLRGMDDMNRDLLAKTKDARLRTLVVHVPVIGAQAKDVLPATKLIHNPYVQHYWNSSGEFGRALAKAVQLKNDKEVVYAWDVWLFYGPDAQWTGTSPPQPQLLMHQLWKLEGTKFPKLDSEVFAREVQKVLTKLPPAATTQQ
ncbi:MAG: hypothetical protein ACREXP_02580 [Steroidobacteraceae bacterium]